MLINYSLYTQIQLQGAGWIWILDLAFQTLWSPDTTPEIQLVMLTLLHHTYLCCSPFKNGRSGKAVEKSIQQPEQVRFRSDQRRVYIQTVAHGIMAPCIDNNVKDFNAVSALNWENYFNFPQGEHTKPFTLIPLMDLIVSYFLFLPQKQKYLFKQSKTQRYSLYYHKRPRKPTNIHI